MRCSRPRCQTTRCPQGPRWDKADPKTGEHATRTTGRQCPAGCRDPPGEPRRTATSKIVGRYRKRQATPWIPQGPTLPRRAQGTLKASPCSCTGPACVGPRKRAHA